MTEQKKQPLKPKSFHKKTSANNHMSAPSTSANKVCSKKTVLKQLDTRKENKTVTACLLCDQVWELPEHSGELFSHLLHDHHLVIADTQCIADIKGYCDYWRTRLLSLSIEEICSTLLAPVKEADAPVHVEGEVQKFFLLSDVLPEDRLLRNGLQQKRLEWVIQQQEFEREDNKFTRGCLFCREVISGTRAQYLDHLSHGHNLQLGHPHNLVFVDELIDLIEKYFERLQCLYCENYFKDRLVLREHMRKKMHKRINPSNHTFDQFYAVNYLEMGKNWVEVQNETEEREFDNYSSGCDDGEVADWEDWKDENGSLMKCLFCEWKHGVWENMLLHLKEIHDFDFAKFVAHMDFYQRVKLVNYIRHQIDCQKCIVCEETFDSIESTKEHMNLQSHVTLPDKKLWDRPEYYFPTHEDDEFLCQLDDIRDDEKETPDCVCGEEINPLLSAALSEDHISEVMELRAAITGAPLLRDTQAEVEKSFPSEKHVTFQMQDGKM